MSIKKVFFVFLFIKVMSGRLKGIVLSVSMLRFLYSLKFSLSSKMAGVYLLLSSSSSLLALFLLNLHVSMCPLNWIELNLI